MKEANIKEQHTTMTNLNAEHTVIEQPKEKEVVDYELDILPADSIGRKLTRKQRAFCRFYVQTRSVKRAALLAGYKEGYGYQAIWKPNVKAFIAELDRYKLEQMGVNRDTILQDLAAIIKNDVTDFYTVKRETFTYRANKNSEPVEYEKDVLHVTPTEDIKWEYVYDDITGEQLLDELGNPLKVRSDKTRAVKNIKIDEKGHIVYEFYDKLQAMNTFAKMTGIDGKTQIEINDVSKVEAAKQTLKDKLKDKLGELEADKPKEAGGDVE